METILIIIGILLGLGLFAWLAAANAATRRDLANQAGGLNSLQQQLEGLKSAQDRTSQPLQTSLQAGQNSLAQSLQSSQHVLSQLNAQVGELQGTNKQMLQLGTDVKRLQTILSSPKLRGQMGEWSLENLLAQALPKGSYTLQHT